PLGQALALRLRVDAAFHEEKGRAMPARERPCRGALERRGEARVENDGATRLEDGLTAVEHRAVDARSEARLEAVGPSRFVDGAPGDAVHQVIADAIGHRQWGREMIRQRSRQRALA